MKRYFQRFKKNDLSDKKKSSKQEDKYIPDELTLAEVDKTEVSPLNELYDLYHECHQWTNDTNLIQI